MLNKIEKGMSNAAEKINENFELLAVDEGEDYIRFNNGSVIASAEVSFDRTQKVDITMDFSIDFDEINAITFTPVTTNYQDAYDVDQLVGLRAYNYKNRIRIMRSNSNTSWSGSGELALKVTVIGVSK